MARRNSTFARLVSIISLAIAGIACGCTAETGTGTTEEVAGSQQQPLTFEKFAKDQVKGSFIDGSNTLSFDSRWGVEAQAVTFTFNGKTVGDVGYNVANDGVFHANADMDKAAHGEMQKLVEAMRKLDEQQVQSTFGGDVSKTALGLLYNYADHMSTARTNAPITYQKYKGVSLPNLPTTEMWGGDGIKYLWQCARWQSYSSRYAEAYWTDWRGYDQAWVPCGLTAPSCEGRCGSGCPCNSWYCMNRYYTQDCLEHDWCLDYNPSDGSTDPFAPNCGDEWSDASDDFLFGSSSGW